MSEIEQLQRLIADIYDATLDRSKWSTVLGRVRDFVGGSALSLYGQQGCADELSRQRLRLIMPHVRRAMAISRMIDSKTAEAAAFAETIDAFSAGVILVDAAGRILHANASGRAMLADGSALRAADGKLVAASAEADRSLKDFLAASGRNSTAISVSIVLPLSARNGACYTAHVLRLASRRRRGASTDPAHVAAIVVRRAAVEVAAPDAIARHFKLTPGELRVLLAVARVGGVAGTAAALGIGEPTVKTHLQRVFGKTGTSRQTELVRLVAGFANPLLN
jgi:DNA-binding CsgD family transcriptional regulator